MKNTVKTALGGMCIGLSAALMMLSSVIPFLTYAIPAMAAILVMFMRIECDWKWGLGVYFGTAIVSALVVPEKEAVAIYIALIGYYPLLKILFDKLPKIVGYIVKAVFFCRGNGCDVLYNNARFRHIDRAFEGYAGIYDSVARRART